MTQPQDITLHEKSQMQKTTYCMISFMSKSRKGNSTETKSRFVRLVVGMGTDCNGHEGFL